MNDEMISILNEAASISEAPLMSEVASKDRFIEAVSIMRPQ